jgi:hypothetical protein
VSYEMKLAGGPSVRRNCSPSGWPTAEFISVLAGKACSTSENSVKRKFNFGEFTFYNVG